MMAAGWHIPPGGVVPAFDPSRLKPLIRMEEVLMTRKTLRGDYFSLYRENLKYSPTPGKLRNRPDDETVQSKNNHEENDHQDGAQAQSDQGA